MTSMSPKHAQSKTEQNIAVYIINDALNLILLWWCGVSIVYCVQLMMAKAVLFGIFVCFLRCDAATVVHSEPTALNNRPIIGILAQEQAYQFKSKYATENFTSYIAASYVKVVESSGARVVPIMIGKNREYYRDIMQKINGVLFPGGATYFNQSGGYADAGQYIYEIAMELNDAGDYFPVFGTCLGFELLVILASGRGYPENRVTCQAYSNSQLSLSKDFRSSKMFQDVDDDIVHLLEHENVTINSHGFCVVDENLKSHNLTRDWRATSHSIDEHGLEYISSIEHTRYPIFGVQFHPEKSMFEWKLSKRFAHSQNAVKANRHFIDFFVQECRKNMHSFNNEEEENNYLIYNYNPYFTGAHGSAFSQCYFFEPQGTLSV